MKYVQIVLIAILLAGVIAIRSGNAVAQADVPILNYNEIYVYDFERSDEQHFAQFNGNQGDVVYFLADYDGFVIGDLEIDLRDSVGRTVGLKEEYAFQEFIIAELPTTGLYTVVITAEEAEPVKYMVGKSGYLEDGITTQISEDGFEVVIAVRAQETGTYRVQFERVQGTLGTDFSIITFSGFFNENIVSVSGTQLDSWVANVRLTEGDTYVAILDRNIFSGGGKQSTVTINMTAIE